MWWVLAGCIGGVPSESVTSDTADSDTADSDTADTAAAPTPPLPVVPVPVPPVVLDLTPDCAPFPVETFEGVSSCSTGAAALVLSDVLITTERGKFSGARVDLEWRGAPTGVSNTHTSFPDARVRHGDYDGDGVIDLFLSGSELPPLVLPGPLSQWVGSQAGTPEGLTRFEEMDTVGSRGQCGDVNGDGRADVCGQAGVDFGPLDGLLDVAFDNPSYLVPFGHDLDGDGVDRVYMSHAHQIWEGPSLVGYEAVTSGVIPTVDPFGGRSVAVQGSVLSARAFDGEPAIVVAGEWVSVLDDGSFDGGAIVTFGLSGIKGAGDFDGDGETEFVMQFQENFDAITVVQIRERDGTLRREIVRHPESVPTELGTSIAVGDVGGDGIDDLLMSDWGIDPSFFFAENVLPCP